MTETSQQSIEPSYKPACKPRRMAREPQASTTAPAASVTPPAAAAPSRLNQLQALLTREDGASIAQMTEATGWQQHSVRGAMAGALKKRGLVIASDKTSGVRRYHAEQPA